MRSNLCILIFSIIVEALACGSGAAATIPENNTIIGKVSESSGGGLLIWSTSVTGRSDIIWGSKAATTCDQIKLMMNASTDLSNSDVQCGLSKTDTLINVMTFFENESIYYDN